MADTLLSMLGSRSVGITAQGVNSCLRPLKTFLLWLPTQALKALQKLAHGRSSHLSSGLTSLCSTTKTRGVFKNVVLSPAPSKQRRIRAVACPVSEASRVSLTNNAQGAILRLTLGFSLSNLWASRSAHSSV